MRLRCAGRRGPDLLPSWPPSSSRPRWSGEPSCAAPSRCGGLERGTTPSLPEPPVVQRRSQPGKIPSWPPRSSSDILEHVSECITARSLTETQLRDLAPQPSALTWAAARSGGRARRGHGAPGPGPGPGQGPGGSGAQPGASSTPRACAGLLGPPVRGDSTCLVMAGCLCPHVLVTGDVALQDSEAPRLTVMLHGVKRSSPHSRPLPGGCVGRSGEGARPRCSSPSSSPGRGGRGGGSGHSHPAPAGIAPAPRACDRRCSASLDRGSSSPTPRQSELLALCWHRLGAGRPLPEHRGGASSPGPSGWGPSPERAGPALLKA